MANQTCWRCLSRLSLRSSARPSMPYLATYPASLSASFSTSSIAFQSKLSGSKASVRKKPSAAPAAPTRTKRMRKKKVISKGKPPAPGERKAVAKRIVLSNTNALDVETMKEMTAYNYADPSLVGKMVSVPATLLDPLRAIHAFQPAQGWAYFKKPATLFRNETLQFAQHIQDVTQNSDTATTMRTILHGPRGSGKSILILQAQAMALQAGWVVIHIPDAQALALANTAYSPLPDTDPVQYIQRDYMAGLLSRTIKANNSILSKLKAQQKHDFLDGHQPNLSLKDLAAKGIEDPEIAWQAFQALWTELTIPKTESKEPRPPMLYSLEGLVHACRNSDYLAPNMHYIHAFDLAMFNHFISYLCGSKTLANGGSVLAADSLSNRPSAPSLDLAVRQSEEYPQLHDGKADTQVPLYDSKSQFLEHDQRVLTTMRTIPVTRLAGLTRDEAKVMLEYFASSGMFQSTITENLVAEKWSLAGGGIIGELERATLRRGHRVV